jgi:hypothetical protein
VPPGISNTPWGETAWSVLLLLLLLLRVPVLSK